MKRNLYLFLGFWIASVRMALAAAPTITSFSPLSGPVGTSVIITGTNFSTTLASNIVYFGATKATVTAATATQLTVTVPIGATYEPISVLVGGLAAYSNKPFIVTFAGGGKIDANSFSLKVDFTPGTIPNGAVIGDLDGDGKPELAVANYSSGTVSVFRNTSTSGSITSSSFASKIDFTAGSNPNMVAIGDLDGDGKLDLVTANSASATVSVFRNTSTSGSISASSFATKVDFTSGSSPYDIAIGDVDGDGKPDLVVANLSSNSVSVLRNTSVSGSITTSSFAAKVDFTSGTSPYTAAVGDLDGDGKPDIVVANSGSNTFSVFRNTSVSGSITASSFAGKVDFTTGSDPHDAEIGDMDGDGKPEVVVSNYDDNTVSVLRNTSVSGSISTSSFAVKVDLTTGTSPYGVTIGDVDGDGKPDIVSSNIDDATVSVIRSTSVSGSITASSFAANVDFQSGGTPYDAIIGDLDGDGKPEITTCALSVFRNNLAVPTITSFTPTSGAIGASVTITGTGFSTTTANNIVYFGATKAIVTAATTTQLTVTVPTGATYQPITVTVGGLISYSALPFTPTFVSAGSLSASSFATRVDFSSGPDAVSLHLADLDGDGKPDYINGNFGSGSGTSASVRQNVSVAGTITTSSLATAVSFTTGTAPAGTTFGDLDGDGKFDLVVVNQTSNTVSVYRNISVAGSITSSSFTTKVDFTTGSGPNDVSIRDLDGDGLPEIVTANMVGNSVSVLRNTSAVGAITSSSFAAKVDLTTGTNPWSIAIGDIDNDGKPDLAVSNSNSSSISIFRNTTSTGTITSSSFAAKVDFTTGTTTSPRFISLSDLDGDSKLDIAVANNAVNTVSLFRNTSTSGSITTGSMAAKVDFTTGTGPWGLTTGDLDGDGKPEIAVINNGGSSVSLFKNMSTSGTLTTSSFSAKVDYTTGSTPVSVVIGDIDGDGRPDLSTMGSTFLSVFRNTIATLTGPTIASFSPQSGAIGSSVTIAGTNFSSTLTNNIVYFGATKALVTAATTTQLTVTVPTGATFQPITVTVSGLTAYSATPFVVTFTGAGAIATSSFATNFDFTTGSYPSASTNVSGFGIEDFDGDGKSDLAVADFNSNSVAVFRNTSTTGAAVTASSLAAKANFTTGSGPYGLAIGDIDSDGKPDLAVANYTSGTVSVLLNTSVSGSISFASKVDLTTAANPYGIAIGDIDGDGKPDLAITTPNGTATTLYLLKNNGAPGSVSFSSAVGFTTSSSVSVVISDLNSDNKPEVIVGSGASGFTLFNNTSTSGSITTSSLATGINFSTSAGVYYNGIAVGDLDGDGKPDLAVGNVGVSVQAFRNTSSVGTITASSFSSGVNLTSISSVTPSIADLDGDGKLELVLASRTNSAVSVLKNTSTSGSLSASSFATGVSVTSGASPTNLAIGDIDGDGTPDIITANYLSSGVNTVSVIKNQAVVLLPTITSFSPQSGAIGSSVVITGTNFSTTLANNIVYFGATKAIVTAATITQLTVTVPSGATYQPVRVTVGGLTASAKPFDVTFSSTSTIDLASFAAKVDVTVGAANFNNQISVGDLDGDLKPDLAIADQTGTAISVIRNTSTSGSITFSSFVDFTTGAGPQGVAVADMDGDGKLDIASTNNSGNTLSTFRNVSTSGTINASSFSAKTDFSTGTGPIFSATGDIDSDGKLDMVVTNSTANSVSIFKNTSTGGAINFATKSDLTTGTSPRGVALGDIDGDGKIDLAVANYSSASFSVFRNTSTTGTISFATKVDVTVASTSPLSLALGDLDADGKLDLVVTNDVGVSVSVFRNTSSAGSISFAAKIDLTAGTRPYSVTIGDLDGDGKPDLAVASNAVNTASLFKNTSVSGTISFNTKIDFTTGTNPTSIAVADFDGDGKPDLAALNSLSPTVSIFRNTMSSVTTPTITSFSPTNGPVGTTVVITGTNFSATPASNTIKFNSTLAATPSASSTTSITTKVPTGASTGAITVTVGGITATSTSNFIVNTPTSQGVVFEGKGIIGGTLTDYIQSTAVDASGNIYVAGGFSGTVNFNGSGTPFNLTSLGGFDAFFAKYSSAGALVWADQIGSTGDDQVYSITVDASNNVYVTGYFNGTVDFDPGTGVSNLASAGAADIFYGKYSSAGAFTWAAVSGSTGADAGNTIKVDGAGNVYVAGFFNGTVDFDPSTGTNNKISVGSDDIFLMKLVGSSTLPTLSWVDTFGSTGSDTGYSIDLDNSSVYISGFYSGSTDFDPSTSTSSASNLGGKDAYFAKYSTSTGAMQWWATVRSTGDDWATSIVVSGTNFYIAGVFSTSASFYSLSGNVTKSSNGGTDIFVAKYDGSTATPTLTWVNAMGGTLDDGSNLLAVDASGNAYSTGYFQGTVDFDPNGTTNLTSAGGEDAYLASYASSTGSLRISNRIGGISDDEGTTIAVDAANNIYLGGYFQGTASFDFTSSAQDKTSLGLSDGFLIVYGQTTVTVTPVSVQVTSSVLPITYDYGGTLTASITVDDHTKISSMQFNSLGITQSYVLASVTSQLLTASGNTYQVTLPAASLTDPIGVIYYFRSISITNDTTFTLVPITTAYLHYPSSTTSQAIPGLSFGDQASNYQIVAVPLTLTKPNVTDVFSALGAYDNTKWRLFDYTNGDNREYPGFSTIVPGSGYWLIARTSTTINPGEGSTMNVDYQTPFTKTLKPGWNLIGNPFNFRISWNDIVATNKNDPAISDNRNWKLFTSGALTKSDVLYPYRGAFVFNSGAADFTLNISAIRNTTLGGRESGNQPVTNPIDQQHWEVALTLSNGELSNELGGIGMDPRATLTGKDSFDEVSVPVPDGLGFFELAYPHPELHALFNKEVVPTQENFTWNFEVKRPEGQNNIELKWVNDYFGDNTKRLVLFDPATIQLTDMRIANSYKLSPGSNSLRFLFGTNEYIQHELDKELPWLGSPYPNPAIGMLTIPFRVPENKNQMPVMVTIYDSKGTMVATPVNQVLNSGNYEVKWGVPNGESGMYLIRMGIGSETTKTVKIILN